jgi:hypothetical protein
MSRHEPAREHLEDLMAAVQEAGNSHAHHEAMMHGCTCTWRHGGGGIAIIDPSCPVHVTNATLPDN